MAITQSITPDFDLLREFIDAEQGQSVFREMADGFPRRRQVRACRIRTAQELATACRILQPNGEDEYGRALALCQLVATEGEALVYVEAQHGKREAVRFGSLLVGTQAEVLGTQPARALIIPQLRPMPALYC